MVGRNTSYNEQSINCSCLLKKSIKCTDAMLVDFRHLEIHWSSFVVVRTDISTTMLIKHGHLIDFLLKHQNVDHPRRVDWLKVNCVFAILYSNVAFCCISVLYSYVCLHWRCLLIYWPQAFLSVVFHFIHCLAITLWIFLSSCRQKECWRGSE